MKTIDYELFDEQVDRFLRHQMSAEEEAEFKAELAQNEELRQRAYNTAIVIKEMNAIQQQRDKKLVEGIKGMTEREFREAVGIKAKKTTIIPMFFKIAAAACLFGFAYLGVYRYNLYQDTVKLGNASYIAYVQDIAEYAGSRGGDDADVVKKLQELFSKVEAGNRIEATIPQLEELYDKAKSEDSEYSYFIDDIAWNLAIAYLKTGERDKPLPILEEILKRNEGYIQITQPVQKLINDIKEL